MRTEASNLSFWGRWVAANTLGELAGLGIVGAVSSSVIRVFGEPVSAGYALAFAAMSVCLGAVEGAIVGYAQASVLRRQRVLKRVKLERAIAILLKSERKNSRRSYATIVEKRSVY